MSEMYERVFEALESKQLRNASVRQGSSMWQCPVHEDRNPSLKIDDKGDRVLVYCHARCNTDDVLASLGLTVTDLFPPMGTEQQGGRDKLRNMLVRSYLYEMGNGQEWYYVDRYYPKTFRQRLPDVDPVRDLSDREEAKRLGLKGRDPVIYHYPRVIRHIQQAAKENKPATVWWLDGEKDVETAEKHGLVATCPPGFAKWQPQYAQALRDAGEIVLVVDQDKEKPDGTLGAGQAGAVEARLGFRSVGLKVRTVRPCAGKDLSDHFEAGCGVEDFEPDTSVVIRPRGMAASDLVLREFTPTKFIVDQLLPPGLTIFAADPKVGKSWISLDLACGVAAGGLALGALRAEQGSVLYLAREDNYHRLQSRLSLVMGGDLSAVPKALEVVPAEVDWQGGEEGIAHLTEWAEEVKNPRLVIMDTLVKVEPEMGETGRGNAYNGNYTMMARYKQWADAFGVGVLMIHHNRKRQAGEKTGMEHDPFNSISGTKGLTGAADTLWVLQTVRGTPHGELHVTGRDVEEQSVEMRKSGPLWLAVR